MIGRKLHSGSTSNKPKSDRKQHKTPKKVDSGNLMPSSLPGSQEYSFLKNSGSRSDSMVHLYYSNNDKKSNNNNPQISKRLAAGGSKAKQSSKTGVCPCCRAAQIKGTDERHGSYYRDTFGPTADETLLLGLETLRCFCNGAKDAKSYASGTNLSKTVSSTGIDSLVSNSELSIKTKFYNDHTSHTSSKSPTSPVSAYQGYFSDSHMTSSSDTRPRQLAPKQNKNTTKSEPVMTKINQPSKDVNKPNIIQSKLSTISEEQVISQILLPKYICRKHTGINGNQISKQKIPQKNFGLPYSKDNISVLLKTPFYDYGMLGKQDRPEVPSWLQRKRFPTACFKKSSVILQKQRSDQKCSKISVTSKHSKLSKHALRPSKTLLSDKNCSLSSTISSTTYKKSRAKVKYKNVFNRESQLFCSWDDLNFNPAIMLSTGQTFMPAIISQINICPVQQNLIIPCYTLSNILEVKEPESPENETDNHGSSSVNETDNHGSSSVNETMQQSESGARVNTFVILKSISLLDSPDSNTPVSSEEDHSEIPEEININSERISQAKNTIESESEMETFDEQTISLTDLSSYTDKKSQVSTTNEANTNYYCVTVSSDKNARKHEASYYKLYVDKETNTESPPKDFCSLCPNQERKDKGRCNKKTSTMKKTNTTSSGSNFPSTCSLTYDCEIDPCFSRITPTRSERELVTRTSTFSRTEEIKNKISLLTDEHKRSQVCFEPLPPITETPKCIGPSCKLSSRTSSKNTDSLPTPPHQTITGTDAETSSYMDKLFAPVPTPIICKSCGCQTEMINIETKTSHSQTDSDTIKDVDKSGKSSKTTDTEWYEASCKRSSKEKRLHCPEICETDDRGDKVDDIRRSTTPQETRYALTVIKKYEDFTLFEIMASTTKTPKKIPCKAENVFTVRNPRHRKL